MSLAVNEQVNFIARDVELISKFRSQVVATEPAIAASGGQIAPDIVAQVISKSATRSSCRRSLNISRMPEQISTTTAAAMLGVSRPTVMKYIEQGKLSSTMVGAHYHLDSNEVLEFLEERNEELRRSMFEAMNLGV